MDWTIDTAAPVPASRQLVEIALDAAATDRLAAGARLPSVRQLAAEAMVNHNTVARAYRELEHLGVTEGVSGKGVFVTRQGPKIARRERLAATLVTFNKAAQEALRAGHPAPALEQRIRELRPDLRSGKSA